MPRFTGKERELLEGRQVEFLGTEERIVDTAKTNPCAGASEVGAAAMPGALGVGGAGTATGAGYGNAGANTAGYNSTATDNVY